MATVCECHPDLGADWQEQGWCCRECAIVAHLAWCREHGIPVTTVPDDPRLKPVPA